MDDLYREVIIDRYKNPHHRGSLNPHDIAYEDDNPLCGDHIRIEIKLGKNDQILDAVFDGHGCSISQASADLLIDYLIGKSVAEARELTKQDILDMLGIELGPVRLKCALLSLKVVKAGLYGLGEGEATDDLIE